MKALGNLKSKIEARLFPISSKLQLETKTRAKHMAFSQRWYSNEQYYLHSVAQNGTDVSSDWLSPLTLALANVHPVAQAFIFTLINWLTTTLGAAAVFLTYKLSMARKKLILECMFGYDAI